ncbi:RimK family alpha-L-glutamate ligase [Saccharicrinis sp. FJH54]|uniref:ATP-grasp domain-containing protein n=1 Tax=Saccharicrinis sp. FJH54 TaxID=3344665 RepID=UPI0035D4648B
MKVAIHHTSGSFSDIWLDYCKNNNIDYKIVNCHANDIIDQLKDCQGLMWHWDQNCYKAAIFARQLTYSLEKMGIKVFPNINTSWHHDDKVGQKYLFESIGAPFVMSYTFYSKEDALSWLNKTTFPKVFKLRGGAGSVNVKLVNNKTAATKLVKKAFKKGFSHINKTSRFKDRYWVLKRDKNIKAFRGLISGFFRLFIPTELEKYSQNHKGYIYFQDFIPDNDFDTRLVIIGDRCYGIIRYCRKGDFRASGSGIKSYDQSLFDTDCINIAFETSKKLSAQSVAFDFIKEKNQFKIVEISYCFVTTNFPGYWDRNLIWHSIPDCPQTYMIKNFLSSIKEKE